MIADSNSSIAWHRAQLKKHRETLKDIESGKFTIGEIAGSKKSGQTQKIIADLKRKIRQSEQIIAAHEKQTMRPRATDHQSLASIRWSGWNARGLQTRNGPR
jgi:hypothetical protein